MRKNILRYMNNLFICKLKYKERKELIFIIIKGKSNNRINKIKLKGKSLLLVIELLEV